MSSGPTYNVPYRRRREGKTNYPLRRRLIRSGLPRIVVRKTKKHIIIQLFKAEIGGDIVKSTAHSSELKRDYNWKGSLNNLPASYLTGLICGYRSISKKITKAVLDIGLQTPSSGSRIFGALKGLIDAGLEVPHKKTILPDDNRISGQHIINYATMLKSEPESYSRIFSYYLSQGFNPEKISENFQSVKNKILKNYDHKK